MRVFYEDVMSSLGLRRCITPCPFDNSLMPNMVGSYVCHTKCFYFRNQDNELKIVECSRDIPEGIIKIDTTAAKILGFTSDAFNPASYLWRVKNIIVISMMISNKKGEFCKLMQRIQECGFDFQIPTPSARMKQIGEKQGWHFYQIESKEFGGIDVLTNIEEKKYVKL
ncbi:MAG: hypothetical protein FWB95_02655 [Treponema sp.]|nr:hypothetical protein [Treponema sp.]